MADISKCAHGCANKHKCYRWTAPNSYWQAYSGFSPDESGICEDFWDNSDRYNDPAKLEKE